MAIHTHHFYPQQGKMLCHPKVEYSLTDRGKDCIPVISDLREYGFRLMKEFGLDGE